MKEKFRVLKRVCPLCDMKVLVALCDMKMLVALCNMKVFVGEEKQKKC